jgi:hypothetical protein
VVDETPTISWCSIRTSRMSNDRPRPRRTCSYPKNPPLVRSAGGRPLYLAAIEVTAKRGRLLLPFILSEGDDRSMPELLILSLDRTDATLAQST